MIQVFKDIKDISEDLISDGEINLFNKGIFPL